MRVKLHNGRMGQSWRIMDPHILRRIGKDPAIRRLSRTRHMDAIRMNPIWKHGFIDVQGIVKGTRFRNRRDAVSYAYKYLTKSLTNDHGEEVSQLDSISDCRTKGQRIALWGRLCNKSFGLRDITFRKKVKEYLDILPDEPAESEDTPTRWEFMRTIPKSVYNNMQMWEARRALRPFSRSLFRENRSSILSLIAQPSGCTPPQFLSPFSFLIRPFSLPSDIPSVGGSAPPATAGRGADRTHQGAAKRRPCPNRARAQGP